MHRFAKGVPANIAVVAMMSVAAAVASGATAAADPAAPPPPPDPAAASATAPVSPGISQGLGDILSTTLNGVMGPQAQTGSGAPMDFMLGQNQIPAAPGTQPPPPGLDLTTALNGEAFLLPQNFQLAAPDEGNMYSIGQGQTLDQPRLLPSLKGAHAIWHAGMGKLDLDQLGQPLPGTAPPPGFNLPPGPVDFLPDGYGPPPLPPGAPPVPWTPPPPPPAG